MEAFQRSWLATCTVAGCTMWESRFEFFFALKVEGRGMEVPRVRLDALGHDPDAFARAMLETGFVVLTDLGEGEQLHRDMMADFATFVACSDEEKRRATSTRVYKNERHVPMWYCGYEGEQMREAFRVCSGLRDIGSWPSDDFRQRWAALSSFLQDVCDRCLSILLQQEIRVIAPRSTCPSTLLRPARCCERHVTSCICWQAPADPDDDKSVAYAVHYPNDRGGQQEEGINIKQHYDPSLVVIEPIADAPVCMLFFRLSLSLGALGHCERLNACVRVVANAGPACGLRAKPYPPHGFAHGMRMHQTRAWRFSTGAPRLGCKWRRRASLGVR